MASPGQGSSRPRIRPCRSLGTGPDPSRRNGIEAKSKGTVGAPKTVLSANRYSKFGSLYCPVRSLFAASTCPVRLFATYSRVAGKVPVLCEGVNRKRPLTSPGASCSGRMVVINRSVSAPETGSTSMAKMSTSWLGSVVNPTMEARVEFSRGMEVGGSPAMVAGAFRTWAVGMRIPSTRT